MPIIAIDTETTGPDFQHGCKPFFVSMFDDSGNSYGFEWIVDPFSREVQVDQKDVKEIKQIIKSYDRLVFHNSKFDIKALASIGIKVPFHKVHDTHLLGHTVDSEQKLGLKQLCIDYLDYPDDDQQELNEIVNKARRLGKKHSMDLARANHPHFPATKTPAGKGKGWWLLDMWLPKAICTSAKAVAKQELTKEEIKQWEDVLKTYAMSDAERTLVLFKVFYASIRERKLLSQYELNRKLLKVTYEMEVKGITLKTKTLKSEIKRYENRVEQELNKASQIGSEWIKDINVNSSKQLSELLYDHWKLPVESFTMNNNPATDAQTLLSLREKQRKTSKPYQFITSLIIGKKFQTAKRYLEGYQNALKGNRLYPNYNLVGTSTTRFSSSNPNAQNIGKGGDPFIDELKDAGLNLRKVFGPAKGKIWYALDYSQLQLRIFAHVSKQENLIQAFNDGYDAHDFVAHKIFNIPMDKPVSSGQRRIAKNVNFGFIFGASPRKIEETARIKGLWNTVTKIFPNAHKFIQETKKFVDKNHCVFTPGGYQLWQ